MGNLSSKKIKRVFLIFLCRDEGEGGISDECVMDCCVVVNTTDYCCSTTTQVFFFLYLF